MKNTTRYITIGGTFLCALGIGYFMQSSADRQAVHIATTEEVSRADFKPLSQPALPDDVLERISQNRPEPATGLDEVSDDELVEAEPAETVDTTSPDSKETGLQLAALPEDSLPDVPAEPEVRATPCEVTANASVEAGALVRFDVSAPCLPNERAVVHHNGMMFTAVTDGDGFLTAMVPALSQTAVMIVEFSNGEGTVATTEVTSLAFYDRVVLQWAGPTGFQLHAREYGADYGSEGHVWSGAARDVGAAALGQGGFISLLGVSDTFEPRMVEVYTFPSGTASRDGNVALSVEAQVTAENCGRDIEAQSIELSPDGRPRTQYVTLAVPDCASIGDFLVLNNLVDDLKIATN